MTAAPTAGRRLFEAAQVLLAMGIFVAAWEAICISAEVPVWLLPAPSAIWDQTLVLLPVLPAHIFATSLAIIGGFLLAIATAVPLAVADAVDPVRGEEPSVHDRNFRHAKRRRRRAAKAAQNGGSRRRSKSASEKPC